MFCAGSGERTGKTISRFLSPEIGPTTRIFDFVLLYGWIKTPFVLALNKVDRIHGWECKFNRSTAQSLKNQSKETLGLFEKNFWNLVGKFSEHGFNIDLYSKISDLTKPYGGLGISILSTPKGVMSDHQAKKKNVGGEILCEVF